MSRDHRDAPATPVGPAPVRSLHPVIERSPAAPGIRQGGLDIQAPALEQILDWPRRTALVIGADPHPNLMAAMRDLDFGTSVSGVADAERAASLTSPCTFVFVGADVFDSDEGIALVRRVLAFSPAARVVLDARTADRNAQTVIRALRAGVAEVIDAAYPGAVREAVADGLKVLGASRERVLAVGAHHDDVEIGCAGTLLDHRLRGDRVTILTLTRGAAGGDQRCRLREATSTAESIGAQLILGDLPDTRVDDGIATIRLIEDAVRAVDPTVVYVHSRHDNHQDHRAVSAATASATRSVGRVYAYQSPSATNDYRPTCFLAIDHVLQRKVQVLMLFDSQNGRTYLEPELVVAGSRYWARHLSADARYAEPFEVIRSVGDLRGSDAVAATAARPDYGLPAYEPQRRDVNARTTRTRERVTWSPVPRPRRGQGHAV